MEKLRNCITLQAFKIRKNCKIILNEPWQIQALLKIANLRLFKASQEEKSGKYTCKTLRRPYFRAYKNRNKSCIYVNFTKINAKLSIRIKSIKLRTPINAMFLECKNRIKSAQLAKKCSQTVKIKQSLYLCALSPKIDKSHIQTFFEIWY